MSTMNVNRTNFLISLASALATLVSADGGSTVALRQQVWVQSTDEAVADLQPAYVVLRSYAGDEPEELRAMPMASIQVKATGKTPEKAEALISRLFGQLYGTDGLVRHMWKLDAKVWDETTSAIIADASNSGSQWEVRLIIPRQQPSLIEVDERGRSVWVFNMDVQFHRADPAESTPPHEVV